MSDPKIFISSALAWLVFKLNLRIGCFDPERYRREIYANTDFRKFDDGLLMTVDCSDEVIAAQKEKLEQSSTQGIISYDLPVQEEALMTCVAPTFLSSEHMHFVDGAGGGYALAAQQLKTKK